ncbi:uncharacterized protein LOC128895771 [Hylaeus anthracinus]|uniref:uncharacterized protein LOC128877604 n=1 Tax=Hylaeus volcanicus TaxID=313075 RepID=UPI0023B7C854|nr:uncharacterized protein LOC128877604 [Hylaeus volcanicus]XP_054014638.1 uncharacterized protein LOC128895771 [Hylaeus anthracinus]
MGLPKRRHTNQFVLYVQEYPNSFDTETSDKMHLASFAVLAIVCGCFVSYISAEDVLPAEEGVSSILDSSPAIQTENDASSGVTLNRQKRTLFLKKKLLGAGLLGFGLGIAKGYKAGYYTAPEVHHVYLSPPPPAVKYVEYVEKPIFVERIVERPAPVFKEAAPYGAW